VDEATGGLEAVRAAATGAYQLILIDCQMPDMDGLAATIEIRRQETADRRAFIVALTADVSAEQRARCRAAGMDEFLEKPLRLQTLAELLNHHLRRGSEQETTAAESSLDSAAATPLEFLEADIGSDMTVELVREYLAAVEQAIERLSRPDLPDVGTVRGTAHRLVGGARVLGLVRFERIWASLCETGEDVEPHVTPPMLDQLHEACAELNTWVDSHHRSEHA